VTCVDARGAAPRYLIHLGVPKIYAHQALKTTRAEPRRSEEPDERHCHCPHTVRSPPITKWVFLRMPWTSGWPTVERTGEGCGAEPISAAGLADRLSRNCVTGRKS